MNGISMHIGQCKIGRWLGDGHSLNHTVKGKEVVIIFGAFHRFTEPLNNAVHNITLYLMNLKLIVSHKSREDMVWVIQHDLHSSFLLKNRIEGIGAKQGVFS